MFIYLFIFIYRRIITGDNDDINQQRYNIGLPRCDLNAPKAGTIHINIAAGTGNRPGCPSHSCPQLRCVWWDMSATRPCKTKKLYISTDGTYTHTLDKNGSFKWSVGNWIPSHASGLETVVGVLGLAPCHRSGKIAGTPDWSGLVSPPIASVFVGSRLAMVLLPPARRREKEKKERFYIYLDAHTH